LTGLTELGVALRRSVMGELGCYITTITSKALSFVYHSSSSDCTMRTVVCFVDLGLLWPAGVCLSGEG